MSGICPTHRNQPTAISYETPQARRSVQNRLIVGVALIAFGALAISLEAVILGAVSIILGSALLLSTCSVRTSRRVSLNQGGSTHTTVFLNTSPRPQTNPINIFSSSSSSSSSYVPPTTHRTHSVPQHQPQQNLSSLGQLGGVRAASGLPLNQVQAAPTAPIASRSERNPKAQQSSWFSASSSSGSSSVNPFSPQTQTVTQPQPTVLHTTTTSSWSSPLSGSSTAFSSPSSSKDQLSKAQEERGAVNNGAVNAPPTAKMGSRSKR